MPNARLTPIFPERGVVRGLYVDPLCLAPGDVADISAALVAEFPRLVFRVYRWSEFGDRMFLRPPDPEAAEAKRISRLPPKLRDPEFRFASHLTDYPDQAEIYGLLPPEEWTPRWKRTRSGRFVALNEPQYWFALLRSFYFSTAIRFNKCQPYDITQEGEAIQLAGGRFRSGYDTADPAHGKFARRCKRVFLKHATNRYTQVDHRSGEILDRIDRGTIWADLHALRWAGDHPGHFVSETLKPYEWVPPARA